MPNEQPEPLKVDLVKVPAANVDGPTQTIVLVVLGGVVVAGLLGASVSKEGAPQILGFCGMIVVQLFTLLQQSRAATQADRKVDEAAVKVAEVAVAAQTTAAKVEEVKQILDTTTVTAAGKMEALEKVAGATHTLVNSNMGVQLKLNAVVSRRLADMTKEPADMVAAELADKLLAEHVSKQAVVDSKEK